MQKLPKDSNYTVRSANVIIYENNVKEIYYLISKNDKIIEEIKIKLPRTSEPNESNKIINKNNKFINGYKVVKVASGEYSYIDEANELLVPYRYDIAFDFNEYGYAIVCKDGNVTWINKNFHYLDSNGLFVKDTPNSNWQSSDVWQRVTSFSESKNPLSLVSKNRGLCKKTAYLETTGKLKQFYRYDGKLVNTNPHSVFRQGTTFDKDGIAMADDCMLFDKGYYMTYKDLIKICNQKGIIDTVVEEAEKYFEQPKIKKLINKKKYNY